MAFYRAKSGSLEQKIRLTADQQKRSAMDKSKFVVKGIGYLLLIIIFVVGLLKVGFPVVLTVFCIFHIFSGIKARRHFYLKQQGENEPDEKRMLQLEMEYEKRIRDIPYILMAVMIIFIAVFLAFSLWDMDILLFTIEADLGKLWIFLTGSAFLICETIIAHIYIVLDKEE